MNKKISTGKLTCMVSIFLCLQGYCTFYCMRVSVGSRMCIHVVVLHLPVAKKKTNLFKIKFEIINFVHATYKFVVSTT